MGIRIPQSNVPSGAADEAITQEMHDGLEKATTTTSSLAAEQGSGNISKTQTKATPSGLSSPRTSLEGGLVCHFTMRDSPVQARPERLSNFLNEPPLEEEQAHILRDEEYAQQVQDQWITDEARLAQEILAQAEQWDDVQARIQANEDLAQRMLEKERESLSIEERSTLLAEFIDKRKKMMATKRAEEDI
nr:hypothetical protein [Tanacetum cinerariifolium]